MMIATIIQTLHLSYSKIASWASKCSSIAAAVVAITQSRNIKIGTPQHKLLISNPQKPFRNFSNNIRKNFKASTDEKHQSSFGTKVNTRLRVVDLRKRNHYFFEALTF